jgi:hypothetical protein
MVNHTHPAHFAAHGFKHAPAEFILAAQEKERRQELPGCVFQLDVNGQKNLLLIPVIGKQQSGELVQSLNS